MNFKLLLEKSPVGFLHLDCHQNILYVNQSFCRLVGYSASELIKLGSSGITHPGDISINTRLFEQFLKGELDEYRFQKRYLHRSGKVIWGDVFVSRVLGLPHENQPTFLATVVDITDLKVKEFQLEEEKANFREMFKNNPQPMIIYDTLDYSLLAVNKAACLLSGYSREELITMKLIDMLSSEQQARFLDLVSQNSSSLREGVIWEITTKGGDRRIIESSSHIVNFNDRVARHALLIDVTQREKATKALAENEAFLRRSEQLVGMGSWEWDPMQDITKWSPNTYRLFHVEPGTPLSFDFFVELVHPDDRQFIHDAYSKIIQTRNKVNIEHRLILDSDQILWVETHIDPVFHGDQLVLLKGVTIDITTRKTQEIAILKSRDSIRQAQVVGRMGSWEYDVIRDKGTWSENLFRILKVDPRRTDLSMDFFVSLVHPDDRHYIVIPPDNLKGQDQPRVMEIKLRLPDNHYIWVEIHVEFVYDNHGLATVRGVIIDISERKKREIELLKLSKILDQSPVSIVITNTDGNIEYVNPEFTKITGYSKAEAVGQNPRILKSGKMEDEVYAGLWKTITSGDTWEGQLINKTKQGKFYWENAIISPATDKHGVIVNFLKISEDITDYKRMADLKEFQIKISTAMLHSEDIESFFELVFKSLGQLTTTQNFFLVTYNANMQTITSEYTYDHREVQPKTRSIENTFPGKVICSNKSMLLTASEINALITKGEMRLIGAPAETLIGVPLRKKDQITGVLLLKSYESEPELTRDDLNLLESIAPSLSIAFDRKKNIEDLKNALEKAQESNRLKSAFLATMSHELRTPLNPIIGFANILREQSDDFLVQEFSQHIHRSGKEMLQIIEDLFDLSFSQGNQVRCNRQHILLVDLYSLARAYLEDAIVREGKEDSIEVVFNDLAVKLNYELNLDRGKVLQILSILFNNAVKFTKQGIIEFKIEMMWNPEGIRFAVKDTGIGIAPEQTNVIFDEFRQLDDSHTREYGGLGIGLSIAKKLTDVIGGKISISSKLGLGSCFSLEVPAAIHVRELDFFGEGCREEDFSVLNGKTILIADDNRFIFKLIELMLTQFQIRLLHTTNGKEAVELAKREVPDFILMDMVMPEMDGIEATKHVRNFLPKVPIAALTAHFLDRDRQRAFEAGCDTIVTKPLHRDILLHTFKRYLN